MDATETTLVDETVQSWLALEQIRSCLLEKLMVVFGFVQE